MDPGTADTIARLAESAHANAIDKGFWDPYADDRDLVVKLALVHQEVSEAVEALRQGAHLADKHLPDKSAFSVELADIILRVLDLAGYLQRNKLIHFGEVLCEKHNFNQNRPHKHGKLF